MAGHRHPDAHVARTVGPVLDLIDHQVLVRDQVFLAVAGNDRDVARPQRVDPAEGLAQADHRGPAVARVAVHVLEKMLSVAQLRDPGIDARMPIVSGEPDVSQTLTVAHGWRVSAAGAASAMDACPTARPTGPPAPRPAGPRPTPRSA